MDGDPQASLDALANEVIFRVTEIDDQGLRALTEAATGGRAAADSGRRSRRPSAWPSTARPTRAWPRSSSRAGCSAWSRPPTPTPVSGSPTTAAAASEAMAALPDSATASFEDPDTVAAAQESAMALKVLLATEVASELGVTLGFSDSDGDS